MEFLGSSGSNSNVIVVTLSSAYDYPITLDEVWLNSRNMRTAPTMPHRIDPHTSLRLNVTAAGWIEGYRYWLRIISAKDDQFFYDKVAPSS